VDLQLLYYFWMWLDMNKFNVGDKVWINLWGVEEAVVATVTEASPNGLCDIAVENYTGPLREYWGMIETKDTKTMYFRCFESDLTLVKDHTDHIYDVLRYIASGENGQVLISNGAGVPEWVDINTAIKAGAVKLEQELWDSFMKRSPLECHHSWETYQGFYDSFDYCTKCDVKKT